MTVHNNAQSLWCLLGDIQPFQHLSYVEFSDIYPSLFLSPYLVLHLSSFTFRYAMCNWQHLLYAIISLIWFYFAFNIFLSQQCQNLYLNSFSHECDKDLKIVIFEIGISSFKSVLAIKQYETSNLFATLCNLFNMIPHISFVVVLN